MNPRLFSLLLACASLVRAQTVESSGPKFEELSARATSARLANTVPDAIELYRQALKLKPQWTEGLFYLGTLLYDTDNYTGARDALSSFVALQPKMAPALVILGLSEYETGDYPASLDHLQRGLEAGIADQPQMETVAQFHEAVLLSREGQFEKALKIYGPFAGSANPALVPAIGIAALRERILPKDIPAERRDLFQAAGQTLTFEMVGDNANAERAFGELLNRFPNSPGVHYLHGFYLLATSPSDAVTEFRRELEIDPGNAAADGMLAWVLLNRGEAASALAHAEKAAKGAPEFPTAQYVLGRALVETGTAARGIPHLELAVKLDPKNLEHHLALVTAYSQAGRTQDARTERDLAIQLAKETIPVFQK